MKRWTIYTVASALLVGAAGTLASILTGPGARLGIWVGLGVAWAVQAVAFGILIAATRRRAQLVVAGWTAGTFLRLASLGAIAWLLLGRSDLVQPLPTLLALGIAMFALLILEPVIFRLGAEAG